MINISEKEFNDYRERKVIFPIIKEINGDEFTPINIFYSIRGRKKCILESSYGSENNGRYSFICIDPYMELKSIGTEVVLIKGGIKKKVEGDPLKVIKEVLSTQYHYSEKKLPFTGGGIGYVGYDTVRLYEKLPDNNPYEVKVPETYILFYTKVICYDHYRHALYIIYNVHPQDTVAYSSVIGEIDAIYETINSEKNIHKLPEKKYFKDFKSNFTKEEYCQAVENAKEYIRSGDIFQVVISQRFKVKYEEDAFDSYRRLRSKNPSPYLFYIDFEDFQVVGSSPESLVSVKGDRVVTNPIAGTRRRGKNDEEDLKLKEELLADEKERAEHVMLVDLGRNDIGKISQFGTVKVDRFMEVDYYSHVMHIVSTVSGKLGENEDCFSALRSCLPAGTVSGAPKIRAMEIIDDLENVKREVYSGAVGYFSYDGNMDVCIAIRTIVFKEGTAYIQAGAGIVYDSKPESEYEETLNKVKILMEVIQ